MLDEQAKESDHMGLPVGRNLEDRQSKVSKYYNEEWVQREPHSEPEINLRQSHMTGRGSVHPLQICRLDHVEIVHPRYPHALV